MLVDSLQVPSETTNSAKSTTRMTEASPAPVTPPRPTKKQQQQQQDGSNNNNAPPPSLFVSMTNHVITKFSPAKTISPTYGAGFASTAPETPPASTTNKATAATTSSSTTTPGMKKVNHNMTADELGQYGLVPLRLLRRGVQQQQQQQQQQATAAANAPVQMPPPTTVAATTTTTGSSNAFLDLFRKTTSSGASPTASVVTSRTAKNKEIGTIERMEKLQEFNQWLLNKSKASIGVPATHQHYYNLACHSTSLYVYDLKETLLRSEGYDMEMAGKRLRKNWDTKIHLFGSANSNNNNSNTASASTPTSNATTLSTFSTQATSTNETMSTTSSLSSNSSTATSKSTSSSSVVSAIVSEEVLLEQKLSCRSRHFHMKLMEKGYVQLLPVRDLEGRAILFFHFDPIVYKKNEMQIRKQLFYMMESAYEDVETQDNGLSLVVWNNNPAWSLLMVDTFWWIWKDVKYPFPVDRLHYCGITGQSQPPASQDGMMGTTKTTMSSSAASIGGSSSSPTTASSGNYTCNETLENSKTRIVRHHQGSSQECLHALMSHGIPIQHLPFDHEYGSSISKNNNNGNNAADNALSSSSSSMPSKSANGVIRLGGPGGLTGFSNRKKKRKDEFLLNQRHKQWIHTRRLMDTNTYYYCTFSSNQSMVLEEEVAANDAIADFVDPTATATPSPLTDKKHNYVLVPNRTDVLFGTPLKPSVTKTTSKQQQHQQPLPQWISPANIQYHAMILPKLGDYFMSNDEQKMIIQEDVYNAMIHPSSSTSTTTSFHDDGSSKSSSSTTTTNEGRFLQQLDDGVTIWECLTKSQAMLKIGQAMDRLCMELYETSSSSSSYNIWDRSLTKKKKKNGDNGDIWQAVEDIPSLLFQNCCQPAQQYGCLPSNNRDDDPYQRALDDSRHCNVSCWQPLSLTNPGPSSAW